MMHNLLVGGAEFFFYLTNGTMLGDTVWMFVYVVLLVLVLAVGLALCAAVPDFFKIPAVVLWFFVFMTGIGVPITQSQMLAECKSATATMETDHLSRELEVNECRYKKNYYGEFGEWEIKLKN